MNLYLTQDRIGTTTGGGNVTRHEYIALESLGDETHPLDSAILPPEADPLATDLKYMAVLDRVPNAHKTKLAHIYSGCFTATVDALKTRRVKVTYTAAAHEIPESRREFEELGILFDFPHLTDPGLWKRYVGGYLQADLVICPSSLSKRAMESYGCRNVVVIPHGCESPAEIRPVPKTFTVGYLGQASPDKGLRYLFEAWKRLNMKDALLLVAGRNIEQALPLWRKFGGGNVRFMGFVDRISDFYNAVNVYVQPSATEGFGIEIVEALAHGRPVIASDGAGASELVGNRGKVVPRRDVDLLAAAIADMRNGMMAKVGIAPWTLSWEAVRQKYVSAWRTLLQ